MSSRTKHLLSITALSLLLVGTLQWFLYEIPVTVAQLKFGSIPSSLLMEMGLITVAHSVIVASVALLLALFNKCLASYVALILVFSLYVQFNTGANAAGPALALLLIAALGYVTFIKSRQLIRYYQAK
ncbi:hypothetical protein N8H74_04090 [Pseudomonas sp. B2M1-30]|uniref:hypothetical protein n=1 Tax=Pseudomonas TaxID=286 RepID=UPI0021C6F4A3|nr:MULTISPECIES: hypothetical protein [Pseudomonas]MCU0117423.1 hypothetical protein [Pseudomonas sp. B2M1-30]MCU7258959.1 hypothetical protein [Pseudomonas koreensis]